VRCGTHRNVTCETTVVHTHAGDGFTFPELVIVVLILGIITMMALPAMNDFFTEETLNAAADAVVAAIYYARSVAITTSADHGVVFSSESNSFRVMRALGTPSEESYVTVEHPAAKRDYVVSFDDGPIGQGVDLNSAQFGETSYVRFNNLGIPLETGFVLLKYGGKSRKIEVMATSCEISS